MKFEGRTWIYPVHEELPTPQAVLAQYPWQIEPYNGPYLAGKSPKPTYGIVELTKEQAFGLAPRDTLPSVWTNADSQTVIGDLSDTLTPGSSILLVKTPSVIDASELATAQGYKPVRAGQFLQALWLIKERHPSDYHGGYFYCYSGRKPGYAVAARYANMSGQSELDMTFDTHPGTDIAEGYFHTNWEVYCMFVK